MSKTITAIVQGGTCANTIAGALAALGAYSSANPAGFISSVAPVLSGIPTTPTAAVNTNTLQIANTAFVQAEIANDAPTKTGGGASGSWPISVTGTAGGLVGNLPVTNLNSGLNASATTYWRGDGTWAAAGGGSTPAPSVIAINTIAVINTTYIFTASLILTLPLSPVAGNTISFSNFSNTKTCVIARNGQNIMSLAQDLTIDLISGLGQLLFIDATRGWILI